MHLGRLSLLAVGAATVNAFRDTSPFFLASTSEILASSARLKTATSLLQDLSSELSSCPSDYYVIASQPGVHSTDFSNRKSAPRLGAKMTGKDKDIRSTMTIHEVAGVLDAKQIQNVLERECGAQSTVVDKASGSPPSDLGSAPRVLLIDFPVLSSGSDRAQQLVDNDGLLSDIIERLPESKKYSILYVTSPREFDESDPSLYQSESNPYQDPIHMDLKRDHSVRARQVKPASNKSLFQEYQYFTPGIFMGLMASFVCLAILYVGLSALMSLQVPYAAFEKDSSSAVQKKQQ
ncbi:Ac45/VOA1 transmembrane domain-containing protein [Aspergillus affinis]|uniref:Ac45/VOA1 transmembrane domain-containing protein n=1 Tax=Aspergillus affinis TaxID=1070780 RepID=UPI0022FE316D|nr:BIG1-domain-containing protein [Aspergillus affinis]KAI9042262.1 BIG1-domain-containing protein [Aspergillus affinis]